MQAKFHPSRRDFIRTGTLLLTGMYALPAFAANRYQPKLSFSTLGCPDWDFDKITAFAAAHGYQGLEIRGIQREMDLPKAPIFQSAAGRAQTLARMKEKKLHFVGLGSSCTLHFKEAAKRQQQLEDGKRFIDLAEQLNCPYIRVFPNNFPKEQSREETMELIKSGLVELAEHARGSKVEVLMETHGDLVKTADLEELMMAVKNSKIGLIWDISNMWTITGEAPSMVYLQLKKYIRHVHVKDAVKENGKLRYTFLGQGEVPVFEGLDLLARDRYRGYLSFEWEKLWHPEIAEPEAALADYPQAIKKHFL
ncbi:sugar phosphate isomerase/epimerase family protein [Flavihumibacter sp. CACIAM 22H1]|uniref:sugar phosphate isomerase/epimerase family protein n=1 Tax=Flavihumibacter sp. CACIAM 22H1 TaxID=1812911 RepID=UPI0007A8E22D|nr:sugar phosphate isomerase/epimerase family protein [Flavihumibacter sp. CACIAM 22H1]KYP16306.1 MAG: xylose isomerase [Flavihumibacter sp. CACIAM 22H1]